MTHGGRKRGPLTEREAEAGGPLTLDMIHASALFVIPGAPRMAPDIGDPLLPEDGPPVTFVWPVTPSPEETATSMRFVRGMDAENVRMEIRRCAVYRFDVVDGGLRSATARSSS